MQYDVFAAVNQFTQVSPPLPHTRHPFSPHLTHHAVVATGRRAEGEGGGDEAQFRIFVGNMRCLEGAVSVWEKDGRERGRRVSGLPWPETWPGVEALVWLRWKESREGASSVS